MSPAEVLAQEVRKWEKQVGVVEDKECVTGGGERMRDGKGAHVEMEEMKGHIDRQVENGMREEDGKDQARTKTERALRGEDKGGGGKAAEVGVSKELPRVRRRERDVRLLAESRLVSFGAGEGGEGEVEQEQDAKDQVAGLYTMKVGSTEGSVMRMGGRGSDTHSCIRDPPLLEIPGKPRGNSKQAQSNCIDVGTPFAHSRPLQTDKGTFEFHNRHVPCSLRTTPANPLGRIGEGGRGAGGGGGGGAVHTNKTAERPGDMWLAESCSPLHSSERKLRAILNGRVDVSASTHNGYSDASTVLSLATSTPKRPPTHASESCRETRAEQHRSLSSLASERVSVLAAEMDDWRGEERGDEGLERGAMRRVAFFIHSVYLLF
jgi:hypothetical protein